MKLLKMLFMISIVLLFVSSSAGAGDFNWFNNFNLKAEADPSDFRARLASRFKIGGIQSEIVLRNVEKPANAYMVFRLSEISTRSPKYVIEKYKSGKSKGWGAIAKSLGIKPGSREFHALKRSHDLYNDNNTGNSNNSRGKGNCKGRKWK